MTTIAYRDGVLASDTRACVGDVVLPERWQKVFKLDSGALVGYAGATDQWDELHFAVRNGHPTPELKKAEALMIHPNGDAFIYEGRRWVRSGAGPYYAIGSGYRFALAAMWCGKSARAAIRCAMAFDKDTGGSVEHVTLNKGHK